MFTELECDLVLPYFPRISFYCSARRRETEAAARKKKKSNFTRARLCSAFKYLILRVLFFLFYDFKRRAGEFKKRWSTHSNQYMRTYNTALKRSRAHSQAQKSVSSGRFRKFKEECHFTSIKLTKRQLRFQH